MRGSHRICQCHVHGCLDFSTYDPDTGRTVPGQRITRWQYDKHQADESRWRLDTLEQNVVHSIASTTLMHIPISDTAVSALQGAHSQASSRRSATHDTLGYAASEVDRLSESLSTNRDPDQCHEDEDERRSVIDFTGDSEQLQHKRLPSDAPRPIGGSHSEPHNDTHQALTQVMKAFEVEAANYNHQRLTFSQRPSSIEDQVPSVASLSQTEELRCLNATFLNYLERLFHYRRILDDVDGSTDSELAALKSSFDVQIRYQFSLLEALAESQWLQEKASMGLTPSRDNADTHDTSSFFNLDLGQTPFVVLLSILTTLALYLLRGLSREGSNFLLQATRLIASAACLSLFAVVGQSPSTFDAWTKLWPTDIRTVLKTFNLDPDSVEYVCCKKCCACYLLSGCPDVCEHRETAQSPMCGTRLFHNRRPGDPQVPIRRFIYQPFRSWLARFLSRSGIEDILITKPNHPSFRSNGDNLERDVWDGEAFATFEGPLPGTSYFQVPGTDLPLVFGLFVDWFNPFGNRASSTSTSVGAIYMVCMNLPIHLRYRMENIYLVGIIPGPKEPSLHHINHFLAIPVRELNSLWANGVFFTRTAAHRFGRLVRCALIPLICDLPGLRKTAGLAGHSATRLCSFCHIVKGNIADLDYWNWSRRTLAEHRERARMWRDAPSDNIRSQLWDTNQIRWTELLNLPYWDITKYAVLDAMHNLFLGHFKRHCVDIWHMQAPKNQDLDEEEKLAKQTQSHDPEEQRLAIDKAVKALRERSRPGLRAVRRGYLMALAQLNGVPLAATPTRQNISEALLSWREQDPNGDIKVPAPLPFPVVDYANPIPARKDPVLKGEVLKEVWHDIRDTLLPSWMGRAPRKFGAAGQGRLKADEWRTACTVHLPITLIRLWGTLPDTQMEKMLLDNFLHLVTAVLWATRRTTSEFHRSVIQNQMHLYLTSLVRLFGPDVLVTNHHVSLHLVDCLRLFGPVHGWWAFPFERYNGILQNYNTNSRLGDLELTFFTTFCRAANFKALLSNTSIATLLGLFHDLFARYFGDARTGTLASDLASLKPGALGDDIPTADDRIKELGVISQEDYQGLIHRLNRDCGSGSGYTQSVPIQPQALYYSYIVMRGIKFSTHEHSPGDSMVLLRTGGGADNRPGRIQRIFVHAHPGPDGVPIEERFLVIELLQDLTADEQAQDPFRRYPLLDIRLYYDTYDADTIVVKASDIVSHFASCPLRGRDLERKLRVVVSLARD